MNNKGFTLIELILVILVLIILITYAVPRISKVLKNSKKNTFLNNVSIVYSKSQEKRIENRLFDKPTYYIYSEDSTSLNLTGMKLYYCILFEDENIKDTELIKYCDVVVVGPFILEQRDISDTNRWRGSRNQRVIKVRESLATGKPVMLENIPNNE